MRRNRHDDELSKMDRRACALQKRYPRGLNSALQARKFSPTIDELDVDTEA